MQLTEKTAGLDNASKEMLHNVDVVSFIMQKVVLEYQKYSIADIKDFIEESTMSEDTDVSQGRTNTEVSSDNKEYQALNEKTSDFDFTFDARNPDLSDKEMQINIHFDFEPQLDYRPGYYIEKRGIYYLSRRISSQLSLVTDNTNYNKLEKCYSIWICRDRIPINERYSVSVYEFKNTQNSGGFTPLHEAYDLMTLVIIRLGDKAYDGKKEDEYYDLFKFLNLIMYPHDKNFINDMKPYVDFSNNTELWKEADNMSGLGMAVYRDGVEQGEDNATVRLNKLISILISNNRIDDLEHSTKDKEFQKKLLDELVPDESNE
jgi:hypothetical protein